MPARGARGAALQVEGGREDQGDPADPSRPRQPWLGQPSLRTRQLHPASRRARRVGKAGAMKILRDGFTRNVILIGTWAVKVSTFKTWGLFLYGVISNL